MFQHTRKKTTLSEVLVIAWLLCILCITTSEGVNNTTEPTTDAPVEVTELPQRTTEQPATVAELMEDKSPTFNATLTEVLGYFSYVPLQKIYDLYYNDEYMSDFSTHPSIGDADETNTILSLILDVSENSGVTLASHEIVVTSIYLSEIAQYLFENIDLQDYRDYGDLSGLTRNFVRTAGSLVSVEYEKYWKEIRKTLFGISNVISTLEKFAIAVSNLLSDQEDIAISGSTIKFGIVKMKWSDMQSEGWNFEGFNGQQIEVKPEYLENITLDASSDVILVGMNLAGLTDYMGKNKTKHASAPSLEQSSFSKPSMLSNDTMSLMMIKYPDLSATSLPVTYRMDYTEDLQSNEAPACVFWNFSRGESVGGSWDDQGCSISTESSTYSECTCTHTTSFSMMSTDEEIVVEPPDTFIAWVIIWAGAIVSIVPYIVLLSVFIYLRTLNRRRRLCLINFCITSIASMVLLVFSELAQKNKWSCMVVNCLMQMMLTSVFMWILCTGLHVVTKTTGCIRTEIRSAHMIIIGWVLPFIMTGVTVGIRFSAFGAGQDCWMNADDVAVQGLLFPILAISAFSALTLALGLRAVIMSGKFMLFEREKEEINKMKGLCIVNLAVIPILIVVWGLGYVSLKGITGMNYLFSIFVSLHGIPVAVLHLKVNGELKSARELLEEEKKKKNKNEAEEGDRPKSGLSVADSELTLEDFYSDEDWDEWDEYDSEYGSRPGTSKSNDTTITTGDIEFEDDYNKRKPSYGRRSRNIYGNPDEAEEFLKELRRKLESPTDSREGTPDSRTESARSNHPSETAPKAYEEPDDFVKAYLMKTRGDAWCNNYKKKTEKHKEEAMTKKMTLPVKKPSMDISSDRPRSTSSTKTAASGKNSRVSSRSSSRGDKSRPSSKTSQKKKEARSVSQLSGLGVVVDDEEEYDPGAGDYGDEEGEYNDAYDGEEYDDNEEYSDYDEENDEEYDDDDDDGEYDDEEEAEEEV